METKKVYQAITAITLAMSKDGISKSRKAQQPGASYNFRGIDDVLNALSGLLAEHQLCIFPRVVNREQIERTSGAGKALFYTSVEVEFDFVSAIDGSMHTARMVGEAMDSSDKSSNKAMSAAYKYMALQVFCIPTEGDNDTENSHHEVAPRTRAVPKQPEFLTAEQIQIIEAAAKAAGKDVAKICKRAEVASLADMPYDWFEAVLNGITPQTTTKQKEAA